MQLNRTTLKELLTEYQTQCIFVRYIYISYIYIVLQKKKCISKFNLLAHADYVYWVNNHFLVHTERRSGAMTRILVNVYAWIHFLQHLLRCSRHGGLSFGTYDPFQSYIVYYCNKKCFNKIKCVVIFQLLHLICIVFLYNSIGGMYIIIHLQKCFL